MTRQSPGRQRTVSDLVNSIPALARGDLIQRWKAYYGAVPHKMISTRLLVLAVAYAVQVEQHGGMAKRTHKQMLRLAEAAGVSLETPSAETSPPRRRKPMRRGSGARPRSGTRFVREWNGKSHVVEVLDKGFVWQGKTYRSLSAIATLITGTRWSGPRFFGVAS